MTDDKTPKEDGSNNAEEDENEDVPQTSYSRLKASHDKLEEKLQAQENHAQAERRRQEDRIKALEASKEEPKEDGTRIANLEVQLARAKAVSKYGLSEDDADLLKGSPEEILTDAEYWAERLKDKTPAKEDKDDKTNKEIIDERLDDKDDGNDNPPPRKPKPKKGNLSWLDEYKAGTPAERYAMDQDVAAGIVDPTK